MEWKKGMHRVDKNATKQTDQSLLMRFVL